MNDYIKRDDAINAIGEAVADGLPNGWYTPLVGLPSADVAPVRHGRWDFDMSGAWCSVCGEYSEGEWDYCPNCGARMDGDSNE